MTIIAETNVSLQQTHQTPPNPSLDSLFHALDPISFIQNNNNSVSNLHHSVLPLSFATQSFIMDMERGSRYEAYAELREKKLRMKCFRQQQQEEEESFELEPKIPTPPPRKQVKFQGSFVASGRKTGSSVLAQSVPDFSAVLRKENRKPMNALPSVMELTPPSKSFSYKGGALSSSRGSKSANAGEKKKNRIGGGGGVLTARKSYASIDELKSFASATANAINGEGNRGGGRSSRAMGKTVLGYRQI